MATGVDNQTGHRTPLDPLRSRVLWPLAILTYVVGDLATTFAGLRYTPLDEAGPIPELVLSALGFHALVALKLAFVAALGVLWVAVPEPYDIGIPLGLAIVGSGATLWNVVLIGIVVL